VKRLFGEKKVMSTIAEAKQQMCSTGGSSLPKNDVFVERLSDI